MIRVTVELVPFGIEEQKRKIGELVLANTGRNMSGECHYHAIFKDDSTGTHYASCRHLQNEGVWKLLQKLINHEVEKKEPIFDRLEEKLDE